MSADGPLTRVQGSRNVRGEKWAPCGQGSPGFASRRPPGGEDSVCSGESQSQVRARGGTPGPPAGPRTRHSADAAARRPPVTRSAPGALDLVSACDGEEQPSAPGRSVLQRPLQPGGCNAGARAPRERALLLYVRGTCARQCDWPVGVGKGRFFFFWLPIFLPSCLSSQFQVTLQFVYVLYK